MLSKYLKNEDCGCDHPKKDENCKEKDEASMTGGGESYSEPIGKDAIHRKKVEIIQNTIKEILEK